MGLLALGIDAGNEVIVSANSYPTVFPVAATGAIPRLVDVDYDSANIDLEATKQAISSKTKAIIAVHLYGLPVQMKEVKGIARDNNLFLIEDCAQAHGASYQKKPVGSFGDIGCFSFYPTKNLGCFGDGGALATNSKAIFKKLKALRMYGEKIRYQSLVPSTHSRLSEIQAAILNVKLKHFQQVFKKRLTLVKLYRKLLPPQVFIPANLKNNLTHAYHLFVIKVKKRDKLKNYLKKHGVQTLIHYPTPIYKLKAFQYLRLNPKNFKNTEKLSKEILSLPLYPSLNPLSVKRICKLVNHFLS